MQKLELRKLELRWTNEEPNFIVFNKSGIAIGNLGSQVTVILRRVIPVPKTERKAEGVHYIVEIVEAEKHYERSEERFEPAARMVKLWVPLGDDGRIAMHVFRDEAFGHEHQLGGYQGQLTINDLLWDGDRTLHVKDIAI